MKQTESCLGHSLPDTLQSCDNNGAVNLNIKCSVGHM